MKYPNWKGAQNEGRVEALLNKLGEPNAEALIADELAVNFAPSERMLFDHHGRCIPRNLRSAVCDANASFSLVQPKPDYAGRLARIGEYLQTGPMISAAEFEDRCQKLLDLLGKDKPCVNIVKGVHLPICIPQTQVTDYGQMLDSDFLPGVGRSYTHEFSGRNFNNYRKDELAGIVAMVPGSRHEVFLKKLAQGPVVGMYFPNPMQGFSVYAQREQINSLPPWFLLAGGFDTATAMVGYPDVLARDFNTPGLDLSALQWREPARSLFFRAHGGRLYFCAYGDLGRADDDYSGGLLVLG